MAMLWSVFCLALLGGAFACGGPAISGSSLWDVSLQDVTGFHICGGSLINSQWVVTAAQCGVRFQFNVLLPRSSNAEPVQVMSISKIINHPDYNPSTSANDIALIKLSSPITFTDQVSPVCLPSSSDLFNGGEECFTTGFGNTNADTQPIASKLQQVALLTMTNSECERYWGSRIQDSMICARSSNVSSFVGDSGGSLVCKKNGAYTLAGIKSWGSPTYSTSMPTVYTRVSSYIDWIERTIADN